MIYCQAANQSKGPFSLPNLPYEKSSFAEFLSVEAFDYHYSKHHQTYVTNLNKLLPDFPELTEMNLEEIIVHSANNIKLSGIFNNAAQIWNHSFFWHCLKPQDDNENKPSQELLNQIELDFGSVKQFQEEFKQAAISQFGSGWAWLVYNNGKLYISKTSNAETPITKNHFPLLTCDVWEHAYYIDYRNKRLDYVEVMIKQLINWNFVSENFANAARLK